MYGTPMSIASQAACVFSGNSDATINDVLFSGNKERQLNWEEEQERRWKMRKELFPNLADDAVIFGNFNQLYKVRPHFSHFSISW